MISMPRLMNSRNICPESLPWYACIFSFDDRCPEFVSQSQNDFSGFWQHPLPQYGKWLGDGHKIKSKQIEPPASSRSIHHQSNADTRNYSAWHHNRSHGCSRKSALPPLRTLSIDSSFRSAFQKICQLSQPIECLEHIRFKQFGKKKRPPKVPNLQMPKSHRQIQSTPWFAEWVRSGVQALAWKTSAKGLLDQ